MDQQQDLTVRTPMVVKAVENFGIPAMIRFDFWSRLVAALSMTLLFAVPAGLAHAAEKPPILLAVNAEYGVQGSQTAQSIEKGVRVAAAEINAAGGLLGGRMIEVIQRDDRGLPARAIDHLRELAENPDVTAVFCGRFSPVALELAPVANQKQMLLLDPWAAADGITKAAGKPNYVFRLSLTDTWAMDAMLRHALNRKLDRLAVFLPNTSWGRSSEAAIASFARKHPNLHIAINWYNWGDVEFSDKLARARADGMKALLMVANEAEGSLLVKQMAALPAGSRLPIISHWGIAGGNFAGMVGPALNEVDLSVVQTFSFASARGARAKQVARIYAGLFGDSPAKMHAQVGFAHAYDLTHLLAKAISLAGSTRRPEVRDALERLPEYEGLVRRYKRAFTASNHEALDRNQVFMARFLADSTLAPLK
jgi:branched-chain amino acid transport system substrate-binding protein